MVNLENLTQKEFEEGVSKGSIKVTLGELIRRRRRDLKITQADLAKQIGVKHSYISKIETGIQPGSYRILAKISQALHLPWSIMMRTGEIEMPEPDDDISVMRTFLNGRFDRYHPVVKEALIEIGEILEKYI